MIDPIEFERFFIAFVAEKAEEAGLKQTHLAEKAFNEYASPGSRWRKLRNQSAGGKPQVLALSDAVRLINALGYDLPSFFFLAAQAYSQHHQVSSRTPQSDQKENQE